MKIQLRLTNTTAPINLKTLGTPNHDHTFETSASVTTDESGQFKVGEQVKVEEKHALRFDERGQGYYCTTLQGPNGLSFQARRYETITFRAYFLEGERRIIRFPEPRRSLQHYELLLLDIGGTKIRQETAQNGSSLMPENLQ